VLTLPTCEGNVCECDRIDLYSLPLCKSSVCYTPKSEKISLSTYRMTINDSLSTTHNINSLSICLNKSLADDIQEKVCCLYTRIDIINVSVFEYF
jgi:hypothetical protein